MAQKSVVVRAQVGLTMPVADLWQALSNTNRLNRATGLPATRFTPAASNGIVSHLEAKARFLGLPVDWDEKPFEWTEQQYFWVERVFKGLVGMFASNVVTGARMKATTADRVEAELFADFAVRNVLGRVAVRLIVGNMFVGRMVAACRTFERNYQQQDPTLPPVPGKPRVNSRAMHILTSALRRYPIDGKLVDRLIDYLTHAPDEDVTQMRPFALADEWGCDRMQTLRLFLYATRAGLLDLSWEVLCPNCRITKASYDHLSEFKPEAHCDTCNIRYDVNFDEYVELRFAVSPQVRRGKNTTYCIGGPFMARHVIAQVRVGAGESKEILPRLAMGGYRLRLRQLSGYLRLEATPASANRRLDLSLDDAPLSCQTVKVAAGELAICLTNNTEQELLVLLERETWDDKGVSAALATSLPEFRAAFSSEVLAPGVSVEVKNLTFLFSDLLASTSLYKRAGDSRAYARVRDHFAILKRAAAEHEGFVVKTMGDAVMAVFARPEQGIAAALDIQRAAVEANIHLDATEQLCVKLGLHNGPCLAVTANDVLDYFGSTVNIAAKAQNASVGRDIILTDTMFDNPEVRSLLAERQIEPFNRQVKGLDEQLTMYRVKLLGE